MSLDRTVRTRIAVAWPRALALVVGLALAGAAAASSGADDDALDAALATVNGQDVDAVLAFLTSDSCAGRDTPSPGLDEAARYVAERFEKLGLETVAGADGYLAPWDVPAVSATPSCRLVLTPPGGANAGERAFELGAEFVPVKHSAEGEVRGEAVFVGFAVDERKHRWNDFSKIDVRGKVAVALLGEPGDGKNKNYFEGAERSEAAGVAHKAKAAADAGAVALVLCAASEDESAAWLRSQTPWHRGGRPPPPLPLPVVVAGHAAAAAILPDEPAVLRDRLVGRNRSASEALGGATLGVTVRLAEGAVRVPNVVARYRGRDPELESDVVVVGAHLDHIGVDDRGRVHRGADDNGGGIAGLLEVAEAFASGRPATRRSILFLAFTGEEKGLLGSKAWCREPLVPIARTYAMINLDIISRGRAGAIEATLPSEKTMIDKLLPQAQRLAGARLKVGNGGREFFQRSDHFSFHEVGVPTVFFNEGEVNGDYHRWTDTADKVLDDKVANVAKLTCALAYVLGNSDAKGGLK